MKLNFAKEITVSVIMLALLILILNPYHFWMPNMVHMIVLALSLAIFGVYAVFVLKERSGDERENIHRMFADRTAFLSGSTILILAIVYQGFKDITDPLVILTLVVMILSKVASRFYSEKNF